MMVAILSMAYASTVVSFLTVRKLNPIPNSIEDLANYPDMELLAFRGHPIISAAQVGCILIRCVWYFLRFPPTLPKSKELRTIEFDNITFHLLLTIDRMQNRGTSKCLGTSS